MSDTAFIQEQFTASADALNRNQHLAKDIVAIAEKLYECFQSGGKLMICGNGGSAADAQHLSSELLNRYKEERRELPGIALTTDASTITSIGNDYDYSEVFSKQIRALANSNDLVLLITTSGNSANLLQAIQAAHAKSANCILLNGKGGGKINEFVTEGDINLIVDSNITARTQEVHGLVIHCICELLDNYILSEREA